jgi:tRNA 2-thiouridine synthesizing protein A
MNLKEPVLVDARGHRCPVPTLRLRRTLASVAPGQTIRLLADDPLARIDVPHFAAQNGCRILYASFQGDWMTFEVVKDEA